VLQRHAVSHVIVAFGPTGEHSLVKVIRSAILDGVDVHVVPRFFEIGLAPRSDAEFLSGIPLYQVRQTALRKRWFRAKRAIDIALSATAIALLAPVMCTIAITVALTSAGPILFRQPRVGQNGKVFNVLKFRSLQVQASSHVTWSLEEMDGRTPIGRWLRRLSLDELPQLFNILQGDMSIVGPRPERVFFVDQFEPIVRGYADRHRLPVGLTGLAQVNGLRGDTSIEMRARYDNYYIEHWSPWLDVMIMLRTAREVLRSAINNLDGAAPSTPATAAGRSRPDAASESPEPVGVEASPSPSQGEFPADQAAGGTARRQY
jgi:exopolysaccharide biosynthesis polyprenyl glycosylphosphotransferase